MMVADEFYNCTQIIKGYSVSTEDFEALRVKCYVDIVDYEIVITRTGLGAMMRYLSHNKKEDIHLAVYILELVEEWRRHRIH